jgi:hypothetical protein
MGIPATLISICSFSLLFLLTACEGSTDSTWSVTNESSGEITVKAVRQAVNDTIVEQIPKGDSSIIAIISDEKGNGDPLLPYDIFPFFEIRNEQGALMKKNYTDRTNWEIFIEQTKRRPSHWEQTYEMIVRDKDF